jgi:hypothetical protein
MFARQQVTYQNSYSLKRNVDAHHKENVQILHNLNEMAYFAAIKTIETVGKLMALK